MANPEHLELARQGAEVLAAYRADRPNLLWDFSGADLSRLSLHAAPLEGANLLGACLAECDLTEAELPGAVLAWADFRGAVLTGAIAHAADGHNADFRGAVLTGADFRAANLVQADLRAVAFGVGDLRTADLSRADARRADFHHTDLRRANLSGSDLRESLLQEALLGEARLIDVNLARACLTGTDFGQAVCSGAFWNEVDLSEAKQLETLIHLGPSCVGIDTIYQSRGRVPAAFLRGCGVNESFIGNVPSLTRKAAAHYPLLILHAEEDRPQAERLQKQLQRRGVRCWLNPLPVEESDQAPPTPATRHGYKFLMCVSKRWTTLPAAQRCLRAAQIEEEQAAAEEGLLVRHWFAADLDGLLRQDPKEEWLRECQQRRIADFSPFAASNGHYDGELEKVLGAVTSHAGGSDQLTLADEALAQLRRLVGHAERLQEGFRRLHHSDGAKNQWFDFRGQKRRSYHIRQLVGGRMIEWETAPVVFERGQDFCHFCFVGAMGAQNRPHGLGFRLLVNGEPTVSFDLTRDQRAWHSPDQTVTLLYFPHWLSRDDSSGFFYVSILRDRLKAGRPCRLAVQARGQDSPRWFALFPERQAVTCQAETGSF